MMFAQHQSSVVLFPAGVAIYSANRCESEIMKAMNISYVPFT